MFENRNNFHLSIELQAGIGVLRWQVMLQWHRTNLD